MTGSENMPYKIRIRGIWKSVTGIQDIWRIDDEWWREKPISRIYYMCILKTEEAVVIFQEMMFFLPSILLQVSFIKMANIKWVEKER